MATPVSVFMLVQPGTIVPTPPKGRLYEDPDRPTPSLTLVTVLDSTSNGGTYSTLACQAIVTVTADRWADMCTKLNDHSQQTKVDLTYDSSAAGTNKPLIDGPYFSLVPLGSNILSHVAAAIHAVEERVETGISGDIRDEIRHTKNTVDNIQGSLTSIKNTLESIKAKTDKL